MSLFNDLKSAGAYTRTLSSSDSVVISFRVEDKKRHLKDADGKKTGETEVYGQRKFWEVRFPISFANDLGIVPGEKSYVDVDRMEFSNESWSFIVKRSATGFPVRLATTYAAFRVNFPESSPELAPWSLSDYEEFPVVTLAEDNSTFTFGKAPTPEAEEAPKPAKKSKK